VIGDEIADALLTVKESLDKNSKKIYSLELTANLRYTYRVYEFCGTSYFTINR
jgi:hypothetical protein